MRRLALIVNPSAGGGRATRVLPRVQSALREHALEFRTDVATDLGHAGALAAAAARAGEVAVTLGGDGLVGCVAGVLRDVPGSVLGVLPGGRGNDFARMLGIPADPRAACGVIARGVERDVDLGDVDGRAFVGIASLGFDSEANRMANEAPGRLGKGVYAYAALRALAAWKPARFDIAVDGEQTRAFTGYSVVAANSRCYGGGMHVAPGAEIDDGLLDVVLLGHTPKRHFLGNLRRVFDGTHVHHPAVDVMRAAQVHVSCDRPFTVYADGDPIGETPATIRVLHHALRVLAPAGS